MRFNRSDINGVRPPISFLGLRMLFTVLLFLWWMENPAISDAQQSDSPTRNPDQQIFNSQLLSLESELLNENSPKLERFLTDAIEHDYAPAFYIGAIRSKDDSSLANDKFAKNIRTSVMSGIWNAAFFSLSTVSSLDLKENEKENYLNHAVSVIWKDWEMFSWDAAIRKYELLKQLNPNSSPADTELRTDLYYVAEEGSPAGSLLLLKTVNEESPLSKMACRFLSISQLANLPVACRKVLPPTTGERTNIEVIITKRLLNQLDRFGSSARFFKQALCGNLDSKINNEMICADLLSVAADICLMRAASPNYVAISRLNVCNRSMLDRVLIYVDSAYRKYSGQTIIDAKGIP